MAGITEVAGLVDGTTLRAMRLALGSDVESFAPPAEPDPVIVDLVEGPFECVPDAADRLSRLETRLREQGDRRAVFLTIYTRMTREVHDGIERGRFVNPEWMRRYVVAFAEYYRRAFLAFERGLVEGVPDPWRIAFGTALRGDALVVQDAFLGVNAHINYDLALAVHDAGIDPNRERKREDHQTINGILARLVDVQQEALADIYAPYIDDIDDVFGRLDETVTMFSMAEGREQAWRVAVVLTDFGFAPVRSAVRWVLRATASGAAVCIRDPPLDEVVLRALRAVEAEEVALNSVLERVGNRMDETATAPVD